MALDRRFLSGALMLLSFVGLTVPFPALPQPTAAVLVQLVNSTATNSL